MPIIERKKSKLRFKIGTLVIPEKVLERLPIAEIEIAIQRHVFGKWGDLDAQEQMSNEESLLFGGRLISSHRSKNGIRFSILTQSDRQTTTIIIC